MGHIIPGTWNLDRAIAIDQASTAKDRVVDVELKRDRQSGRGRAIEFPIEDITALVQGQRRKLCAPLLIGPFVNR